MISLFLKICKIEQIKNLEIVQSYCESDEIMYKNNNILNTLYSFNNIMKNLVYLSLDFNQKLRLNKNSLQKLNEFKLLKYLSLMKII